MRKHMYRFAVLTIASLIRCSLFAQNVTGELEVHYINVGQADAIYIECPTKEHSMLIDAGDTRYPGSAANFKAELERLTGGLNKKIDVVVASHPHADHIGSMKWVLENYDVVKYIDDGQESNSAMYSALMDLVHEQSNANELDYEPADNASSDFPDFCPATNVSAEILLPNNEFDDCANPNNCSVVVRVDYDHTSFLFPGDAEKELEGELLTDAAIKPRLNVDVLKAGHHGSNTSSTLDFIKAVSPTFVVVSCGEKNIGTNKGYKHPQIMSLKNFNQVLTTKQLRPEKVEVFDKSKKKWTDLPPYYVPT